MVAHMPQTGMHLTFWSGSFRVTRSIKRVVACALSPHCPERDTFLTEEKTCFQNKAVNSSLISYPLTHFCLILTPERLQYLSLSGFNSIYIPVKNQYSKSPIMYVCDQQVFITYSMFLPCCLNLWAKTIYIYIYIKIKNISAAILISDIACKFSISKFIPMTEKD